MEKARYALDSLTHPKLLVDLWDVEEALEKGEKTKALEMLQTIIEEVRYSDIIE